MSDLYEAGLRPDRQSQSYLLQTRERTMRLPPTAEPPVFDLLAPGEPIEPFPRYRASTPHRPGDLARDCGYGVGIVGEVGGKQHRLAEIGGAVNAPHRRLKSMKT